MKKLKLSHYLPEYLQEELAIGSQAENPFYLAVAELTENRIERRNEVLRSFESLDSELSFSKSILAVFGFRFDHLNDFEVKSFASKHNQWLGKGKRISTILSIVELYCGKAKVSRGYPYRIDAVPNSEEGKCPKRFSLARVGSENNILFVRLSKPVTPQKRRECEFNIQNILKANEYRIKWSMPVEPVVKDEKIIQFCAFQLSGKERLAYVAL